MPSHYLHLILSYQRATQAGLEAQAAIAGERRPAFLLGAVAPDAVAVHGDKRRTHYAVHAGIVWGYRFSAFEQEFADYRERSVLHQYFYRGYKFHLLLDDAWMSECLASIVPCSAWSLEDWQGVLTDELSTTTRCRSSMPFTAHLLAPLCYKMLTLVLHGRTWISSPSLLSGTH